MTTPANAREEIVRRHEDARQAYATMAAARAGTRKYMALHQAWQNAETAFRAYVDTALATPDAGKTGEVAWRCPSCGSRKLAPTDGIVCLSCGHTADTAPSQPSAPGTETKRYERLLASYSELQRLAQAVIDQANDSLDNKIPPLKFTAPWKALAELQTWLLRSYGLRARNTQADGEKNG